MVISSLGRVALPLLPLLLVLGACSEKNPRPPTFVALREDYFLGFLQRNPVTSTYLGGDGYSPALASTNHRFKDYSPAGRREEIAFYRKIQEELGAISPDSLGPDDRVDYQVMKAQITFLLHQAEVLKHYRRSLDTYVVEPFRGVDWQMQQMTDLGGGNYGTEAEWMALVDRVGKIPGFLEEALGNIREGVTAGDFPDHRMVEIDGIRGSESNADYFQNRLPEQARSYLSNQPYLEAVASALTPEAGTAGEAYVDFANTLTEIFVEKREGNVFAFRELFRRDRYATGEREYDWSLANNLRIDRKAAELFDYGAGKVTETQALMAQTARGIAEKRGLKLDWGSPVASRSSVRKVMDLLARDYPKSDEEMFRAYREKAFQLVAYARERGMFDLPADYRLDILETPPVLRESVEASYYPAPPFKKSGIGRFYLTPTGNDVGRLKENNFHAMADLCAHEGFPGHDWDYQFMRAHASAISGIRWLTPGAVEDSSSMWEDSPAAEGWALYAEALMAEPQPGSPKGFYTPEERLYQLQGQLLRDARVHLDTGLHTGRLSFDEAVDYYTENVDFLPKACRPAEGDPTRSASCDTARRAIYRYSKWPTQAITYHLGKAAILDLREAYRKVHGDRYSEKEFHERLMGQGTIPAGYFRNVLLGEAGH